MEIPRSSACDILAVLEELGLVARTESGYALGADGHEVESDPLAPLVEKVIAAAAEVTAKLR